eukprot:COSAG06_NODE_25647_length_632_cov_0.530957_1_plen_56_part_10
MDDRFIAFKTLILTDMWRLKTLCPGRRLRESSGPFAAPSLMWKPSGRPLTMTQDHT